MTEFPPLLDQNDQLFEFSSMSGDLNIAPEELTTFRNLGGVALHETGEGASVVSGEFTEAEMNAFATSTLAQHHQHVMQAHLDDLDRQKLGDDEEDRDY